MQNRTQESPENQEPQLSPNEVSAANELAGIQAQLEEERQAKAALEQAAAEKDARIAELEAALSEAQQEGEAKAAELAAASSAKTRAVAKYLDMAKALNPQVPQGIVAGETMEEIDASVEKARATVEAVRQSLEAEAAGTRVPAGAPTRGAISLEGMSPREKITYAIQQKGGPS